jgi:hypothetical protein
MFSHRKKCNILWYLKRKSINQCLLTISDYALLLLFQNDLGFGLSIKIKCAYVGEGGNEKKQFIYSY